MEEMSKADTEEEEVVPQFSTSSSSDGPSESKSNSNESTKFSSSSSSSIQSSTPIKPKRVFGSPERRGLSLVIDSSSSEESEVDDFGSHEEASTIHKSKE